MRRLLRTPVIGLALFAASGVFAESHRPVTAADADAVLHPWVADTHPTDMTRSHVEEIVASTQTTHRYTVVQHGTMDGRNCRSSMGCGIAREGALLQTWQSNRSVRVENVGDPDVVNPWLSNGRNNFRSVKEIVSAAVSPGMTNPDKAFALWFQEIRYRHHSPGDNSEPGRPIAFRARPLRSVTVAGFDLEAGYVRVEGFEITADKPVTAVQLHGSHCEIVDNYIHHMMVAVNGTVGQPSADGNTRDYSAVTHNRIAYNRVCHCEYGFILGGEDWLVENN